VNRRRVSAIFRKEWLELAKNRALLGMMVALPMILVGVQIVTAAFTTRAPDASAHKPPPNAHLLPAEVAALGVKNALLVLLDDQFALYLMLVPVTLPMAIVAYSIVGEKEGKSLEPLLATPITTTELLLAKALAAIAPAILVGWLSYGVAAAGLTAFCPWEVVRYFVRPVWLVGMGLVSPLLALLSTEIGLVASSRASEPRAAQSFVAVLVVPLVALSFAIVSGHLFVGPAHVLGAAAVLAVLDVVMLRVAVALFQREVILTRWR
jgi:ABC-2 type transport system permease protein